MTVGSGPQMGCPGCGAHLPLVAVRRLGERRMVECATCKAVLEWQVGDLRMQRRA